jgi:hypothetical protein
MGGAWFCVLLCFHAGVITCVEVKSRLLDMHEAQLRLQDHSIFFCKAWKDLTASQHIYQNSQKYMYLAAHKLYCVSRAMYVQQSRSPVNSHAANVQGSLQLVLQ